MRVSQTFLIGIPVPPSPPPSTPPAMPPAMPPAITSDFKVETSFTLSGSLSDYDDAAKASIQKVFAEEAGVEASAVALELTSGSVVVSATIYFASQAAADEKGSALAAGILKDEGSLLTALTTQFQSDGVSTTNLQVEALTSPQLAAAGLSVGAIVGIAVGAGAAAVIVAVALFHYLKKKKKPTGASSSAKV